jgi:mRNA-degrading endonuclease toxin of MazEF toxin-antitoxin module
VEGLSRGDVVLVFYPFASGRGASRRPALIVPNDRDNRRLDNTMLAQMTTNVRRAYEPTQLLVERSTPEGQQAGLLHGSGVSCNTLATDHDDRIDRVIGHFPDALLHRIDECLNTTLGLL